MTPEEYINENSISITESGCWIWIGKLTPQGYGRSSKDYSNTRTSGAHRLSFETYRVPILEGQHVCHVCDIRCCVNPQHLWVGTHADNMRDRTEKGRGTKGRSVHTAESKQKISKSMVGENHHMYNKHHTEETKQKIRDNYPDVSGENNSMSNPKWQLTCEHCGKTMHKGLHNRWHGNNCKMKI
jgi:hypothetical protein